MDNIKKDVISSNWSLNLILKLSVIFMLGISSGVPLAIVLSTLKAFLYEKGYSIEIIGFFGIISLSYSIKFIFAPFLDSIRLSRFSSIIGFRKSWIILLQLLVASSIFLTGVFGEENNLLLVIIFASILAMSSACQDVVIDGYRIELFEKRDQGLAASFYIFGYRFGLLISGAFALLLADQYSWGLSFTFIACIILVICFLTFFIFETRKNYISRSKSFKMWFAGFVIEPLSDFTKNNNFVLIAILILSFKLADAYAGSLTVPFLLEIGYSKTQIAGIVKTFGIFATLFGVLTGGIIIKNIGIFRCLILAAIIQSLSNLAFAYLAKNGNDINALYLVIFTENFSGGIGDAVFVAYLSSLCNIKFSATQYAILTSVASFSRAVLSSSSGLVVAKVGWFYFFIFSTFLAIPTFICLFLIFQKKKDSG